MAPLMDATSMAVEPTPRSAVTNASTFVRSAVSAPAATMLISVGSSNQDPSFPLSADVSTLPVAIDKSPLPEVSTKPPSPPPAPPRASILPLKDVVPSAHTTTLPPLPESSALALMLAFVPTTVAFAVGTPPWPCRSPPTSTVPPPAAPEASIAALPNRPTRSPSTCTVPPVWPVPAPVAVMEPVTTASPPIALSVIRPPSLPTELALIMPV